jgi:CPA2 family monovalent cation:H+ antiporter-2
LLSPLRDLFAAIFFFFVGMQIDPSSLPPALPAAIVLAIVTAGTKIATGFRAAAWEGVAPRGRMRAGTALVARGEFSIVISGLGSAAEPRLAPLAAAYVLILAIGGPILTRFAEPLSVRFQKPKPKPKPVEAAV